MAKCEYISILGDSVLRLNANCSSFTWAGLRLLAASLMTTSCCSEAVIPGHEASSLRSDTNVQK